MSDAHPAGAAPGAAPVGSDGRAEPAATSTRPGSRGTADPSAAAGAARDGSGDAVGLVDPVRKTGSAAGGLVAVVGATGTGKSELSLDIAARVAAAGGGAEIVNADAMQLYRGMDIGTAKLTQAERRGIPHHLLDVLDVTDEASVAAYQREARAAVDAILARGNTPVLVGGSGLYVSAVLFDFRFPARDDALRATLEAELDQLGARALYDRLKAIDPAAAAAIGQFNGRRIVRALEVVELTGRPVAGTLPEVPSFWRPATIIRLGVERSELVHRLDRRVERMWAAGLVAEADALQAAGLRNSTTASRAIGYAQALAQLDGSMTAAEAIAEAQALTRRYARRQVSWFKRYPDALDVDALDPSALASAAAAAAAHAAAPAAHP